MMGRKTIRSGYRVEVLPIPTMNIVQNTLRHRYYISECKELQRQIERHVDGVYTTYITWDTTVVCEHCGLLWEEGEDGEPLCCQRAADEWLAEQGQARKEV